MPRGIHPRPSWTPERYFWPKVAKSPGCWEWTGWRNPNGYGEVGRHGRLVMAHRLSWELAHGPIADGLLVCHHCDNPACVKPDHLFLGSQRDNMQDASRKGRTTRGERSAHVRHPRSVFERIRDEYEDGALTQAALAVKYGVSAITVSDVVTGRHWAMRGRGHTNRRTKRSREWAA